MTMTNPAGITGWRTALRYLRHGDDPARRVRLAAILGAIILAYAMIIAAAVWVAWTWWPF